MELDIIKTQTTWSDASASINNNNLKIKKAIGGLENATYKNKGYFTTLDALTSAYPTGSAGSRAYVGTNYPYAIYVWDVTSNSWLNSGEVGGEESIPLGDYPTKDETTEMIEDYHIILSEEAYEALETKEDGKLYFTYEEE